MAVIKCKMCGGDLDISEGLTVCECEYCGTKQTVPTVDDEKKITLFNRAGRLLRGCEFDKAAGVFESIVADFPEEAEAYWGLVLCKFGIEYVDDPATGKKVPTCHRSGFDSVMEDADFEQACENADAIARRQYREEAKAIEELRRGIIEVSGKEQPYDIFICYKETDENGGRTVDSVIAQDVYDALTAKGYRVFFSRITLEDKLGQEYEPYIFAALNSAKIMLAFGTDFEYFNAVWVKNEWSRFLKLMEKDKSKHLIPCYKGIDAYDMPKEFARLQAQDMGKVGAVQDLLRGIEKLLPRKTENQPQSATQVAPAANATVTSLLQRGNIALEDSDWDKAKELFDRVLDVDPKNAEAYLGLAMTETKARNRDEFSTSYLTILGDNRNISRARQFGGESLQVWMAELEKKRNAIKAKQSSLEKMITLGSGHIIGLKSNGTLVASGDNRYGQCDVSYWEDICSVAAGSFHTVGLKTDGTVEATGANKYGQCDVSYWEDICSVAAGSFHTVGLKADGTVVATGDNEEGQCDVSGWRDIVSISIGSCHTVGLKKNGTVVAAGRNGSGQCNVSGWSNIVKIYTDTSCTVGLRSDGTVVAIGDNEYGQCDVSGWRDIVAIAPGFDHMVGLRTDGSVVAAGNNHYGQCNVSRWGNITAIAATASRTAGLMSNGTVVFAGHRSDSVPDLRDVLSIAIEEGLACVKKNGTVVYVGQTSQDQRDTSEWKLFMTDAEKERTYAAACNAQDVETEEKLLEAIELFDSIEDYNDSKERANLCRTAFEKMHKVRVATEKESKYVAACAVQAAAQEGGDEELLMDAATQFENLTDYKDSAERAKACRKNYREMCNARIRSELTTERDRLTAELPTLKGLFSGGKRRQIEARIAEIDAELAKL